MVMGNNRTATRTATRKGASAPAVANRKGRKLDAFPDKIDLRDWPYQPTLAPLPDQIVNCARVPEVLNQGQEGACTGFALVQSATTSGE